MTNNQLTDEQVVTLQLRIISALSFYRQRPEKEAKAMANLLMLSAAAASELQELRKAERDSEPVAYAVSNDFWNQGNHKQHIDGKQCDLFFPGDVYRGEKFEPDDYDYVFPLYRHAQQPVVPDENTLRIQGIEALETFLTVTTPEPEMVGGIKLTMACCRVLKAIIKNNGWADFNGGKPEKVKAETIISALREPHSDACRAATFQAGNSPVIPEGYVMVPKEPTAEMQSAGASAIRIETTALNKLWTGNAVFRAMLAAAPQEVPDEK